MYTTHAQVLLVPTASRRDYEQRRLNQSGKWHGPDPSRTLVVASPNECDLKCVVSIKCLCRHVEATEMRLEIRARRGSEPDPLAASPRVSSRSPAPCQTGRGDRLQSPSVLGCGGAGPNTKQTSALAG